MRAQMRISPGLIQLILAVVMLILGLAMLPSFSSVLFILAAILIAPIIPLRNLLSGKGVRGWMIAAAAVLFVILGFVLAPSRSSGDASSDTRAAVTTTAKATTKATTTKATTTKAAATTKASAAAKATTAAATTTTKAPETTTAAAAKATRAYHAPSNARNVIEVDGTNKCYRNEIVTCKFWGEPNTEYNIDVYYSTKVSDAEGLENHTSNADGYVEWTWKIGGNTKEGRRYLKITGGGETVKIEFDVLES